MSNHNCVKCEEFRFCWHIRENQYDYREDEQAVFLLTYVGGYAVCTSYSSEFGPFGYETNVISVAHHSIGDINDRGIEEVDSRRMYKHLHTWSEVKYAHESTAMGLHEQMLNLSK